MGTNQIGFKGANQLTPFQVDFSQPSGGPQALMRMQTAQPIVLQPGQAFVLPVGQFEVVSGRYTNVQWYDQNCFRWRNYNTQPGQSKLISSDGQNFRLCNTTGTPVGAVISNVGTNGNATNGYNTITATISAGNSTWGTLVGGTLNTTVTVTTAGNFSLVPHLIWQPAANQTFPYIPPEFCCNLSGNAIGTVTVNYPGAGLTAAGTLTAVNAPGDTNPGGAVLTLNATLTNSGNLTAIWPLTQGTEQTSLPTFTFTGTNSTGMCANVIMDWTVSNFTVTTAGGNMGVSKDFIVVGSNANQSATQNAALTGTSYTSKLNPPRNCWIYGANLANGNLSNNTNVTVQDAGKNFQAIPGLICIPSNFNGSTTNSWPVLAAVVGGQTDTSYIQAI